MALFLHFIVALYRMQNGAESIQANFADLDSRTTGSNASLTPEGGNSGTVLVYKEGKATTIYFVALNGKGGGGNDSRILTIPNGYRPPASFEVLVGSADRSALNSAQISIGADGSVKWRRNSNYASEYTFAVTFVRA